MTTTDLDKNALARTCCGNLEAMEWINLGRIYVHLIDDIIDEDIPAANRVSGAERVCAMGAIAIKLYTHPFFLKNKDALAQAMMTCTNTFADSVAWENSDEEWKRGFSEWGSHSWIEVILVVANICGGLRGYEHMRAISAELRVVSYVDHHDKKGGRV